MSSSAVFLDGKEQAICGFPSCASTSETFDVGQSYPRIFVLGTIALSNEC